MAADSHPGERLRSLSVSETELCWRCPTPMIWLQGTWQCPKCHFKLGCCEGEPQTTCEAREPRAMTQHEQ
jgi:hypothetical protein